MTAYLSSLSYPFSKCLFSSTEAGRFLCLCVVQEMQEWRLGRIEASVDAQHGRLESNDCLTRQDPCATNNRSFDARTSRRCERRQEQVFVSQKDYPFFSCLAVGPIGCQPSLAILKTPTHNATGQPHYPFIPYPKFPRTPCR